MDFCDINLVSIDDNEINLLLIEDYCKSIGINVKSFDEPLDALMYVLKNRVDIIVIDFNMPNLDGIEFVKEYRAQYKDVPVLMVTAQGHDDKVHISAYEAGVNDFLSKPISKTLFEARITNLIESSRARIKELEKREEETLRILGKTAEYKDPETASHVARVAYYSKMLARLCKENNLYSVQESDEKILELASPFHDIGKVGIEDKILLKNGKLDDDEFVRMKEHAQIGYEILKDSSSKYLKAGATIALTHHEKWNGKGYPKRLAGEDIHIYGRITAVADVFDALTSTRPYKKAWEFEDAIELLKREKAEHFDPKLVELFIENIEEVREIFERFQEK